MSLKDEFIKASKDVQNLTIKPSNDHLLKLYSLYKQATEGDNNGKRPGMLDIKGRAKYDAWKGINGMDADTAMQDYINLVKELGA